MNSRRRTELQEFVCAGDRIFTGMRSGQNRERMTTMHNNERIYVDVHVLQTVPPSCVNRDDTGSPKTAVYGGVTRARVSSQAWKHAMRLKFREMLSAGDVGQRTKLVVDLIAGKILELQPDLSEKKAQQLAQKVLEAAGVKVKSAKPS